MERKEFERRLFEFSMVVTDLAGVAMVHRPCGTAWEFTPNRTLDTMLMTASLHLDGGDAGGWHQHGLTEPVCVAD